MTVAPEIAEPRLFHVGLLQLRLPLGQRLLRPRDVTGLDGLHRRDVPVAHPRPDPVPGIGVLNGGRVETGRGTGTREVAGLVDVHQHLEAVREGVSDPVDVLHTAHGVADPGDGLPGLLEEFSQHVSCSLEFVEPISFRYGRDRPPTDRRDVSWR